MGGCVWLVGWCECVRGARRAKTCGFVSKGNGPLLQKIATANTDYYALVPISPFGLHRLVCHYLWNLAISVKCESVQRRCRRGRNLRAVCLWNRIFGHENLRTRQQHRMRAPKRLSWLAQHKHRANTMSTNEKCIPLALLGTEHMHQFPDTQYTSDQSDRYGFRP